MKYLYVVYNKRSCVTGRALFEKLKELRIDGYRIRRSIGNNPNRQPDILIRWGESSNNNAVSVNSIESVHNASNKSAMIRLLNNAEGVLVPPNSLSGASLADIRGEDGYFFVRNNQDHVRHSNVVTQNDSYAIKDIKKTREFRVHVFDEKVVGVYEKIPHEGTDGLIRKDNNCDFVRLDMANNETRRALNGVRPQAKAAVKALGLVFGGADVVLGENGNAYVLEVNSAPALNEPNIGRWSSLFKEFIERNHATTND